ncbi:Autoimmune regulator like [Actinidia chinensis var. chinensis]|uniref:Autoimmune regulator like n=1 Tax=Actinidia chinensis var. chinensis TaxID=1590841 RepID=A0A2R6PTQ6_ACTCC|nr:Autoimmune regulator like [Actinidia chinensis var. chinensis]
MATSDKPVTVAFGTDLQISRSFRNITQGARVMFSTNLGQSIGVDEMRRKSDGGGRPRLCKLPPQPSAMAFSYLGQSIGSEAHPDCSHDEAWVNEANKDDRARQSRKLVPNRTGETVVVAEQSCAPQGIHDIENNLEINWIEKEVCIKCDKGGKLLVCSDTNCPLAVHEECMSCSAQFDSKGNYHCPYCSYKQAMLGTRKARKKALLAKKALSVFLDKGMVEGHLQKQKAQRVGRKETEPSKVLGDTKHDDTGNKVYGDEAGNHSVQLEEDQREERFDVECMTTICVHEVNERNDALSRCGDDARTDDGGQRNIAIEQRMQPGSIIACGDGGACSRKRDTGHRYEIVQVDNSVQERVLQGELAELQAGPLSASSVEKEKNIVEEELDSAEIVKEHGGRRQEEKAMQDQEQGTTGSSRERDFMPQEDPIASDSSHGDSGDVSPRLNCIKKKNQNAVESPNVDHPKRSVRKLSELKTMWCTKRKRMQRPDLTTGSQVQHFLMQDVKNYHGLLKRKKY